jgi:glycosyltransferase involved in cell wall biosynthesis
MSCYQTNPRVSIIIPTYNYGHFIEGAIQSILNQTYTDYEIIIIDDGSTDNTREILQPYFQKVRYVYQENQGLSETRNHGIKLACGEFIIFLDADDFFLPHLLKEQIAIFDTQPSLGLVISGWRLVNERGEAISDITLWDSIPNLDLETWVLWRPMLPSATMFHRQWLEKVGGFKTEAFPAEDVDCVLRMVVIGCQSSWLRQIGVCYRQHERTITYNTPRQAKAFEELCDRFFARDDLPDRIRKLEKQTRYYCLVWSAWRLYHTGYVEAMLLYLQKSLTYTIYSPAETIADWIKFFVDNCAAVRGDRLDTYALTQMPGWQELVNFTLASRRPRVTIITPSYNSAEYLPQAIESILNQTYTDYEAILIDDGSTDNTRKIVESYSEHIRYVYQENQGVSAARNRGLFLARGELIALLDADDLFLPDKLKEQVAVFDSQPTIGIVHSGFRAIDQNNKAIADIEWWKDLPNLDVKTWILYKPVLPSAMMFRRQWFDRCGGFDRRFFAVEDVGVTLKMVSQGCQAAWLPQITCCYRIHDRSASKSKTLKQMQAILEMLDCFFAQINLPESIRCLQNQSYYFSLVWMAWSCYQNGFPKEMAAYLQQSLEYTSLPWAEIVADWVNSFSNSAKGFGYKFDVYSLVNSQEWQQIMQELSVMSGEYPHHSSKRGIEPSRECR